MADSNMTTGYDGLKQPYSPEAEQAVLGAILMEADSIANVAEILPSSEYFFVSTHRLIYSCMLSMFTQGRAVDFVLVLEELKRSKGYDDQTSKVYLAQLAESCPSVSNVEYYAKLVKEKYEMRQVIQASKATIEEANAGENASSLIIDAAEQRIFDIRKKKDQDGLQGIREVLLETFDRLDLLNKDDDTIKPIPTGVGDLDRVLTGLNKSDLILLAARPGMGKTSFALNIAKNVALNSNKSVAFFSLEMTKEQLASRLLSMQALVPGTKLRTGKLTDEEWQRLIAASDVLGKSKIYLDDTPGITVPEMKAKLRRRKDIDVVFIDYLQLMSGSNVKSDNRVQVISEITRNLKIMAKEIGVPVICLSQLSRESEKRSDHRPQLSDLRDSGSIEQDADIVLFLYRDFYYDKDNQEVAANGADQNSAECIVAKNRHGEMTNVKLHWRGEYMLFTSVENNREE